MMKKGSSRHFDIIKDGFFEYDADVEQKLRQIAKGRDDKDVIEALFGGRKNLPSSVMRAQRGRDKGEDELAGSGGERSYSNMAKKVQTGEIKKYPKGLKRSVMISGGYGTVGGAYDDKGENTYLSNFPQNVGRTLLLFYTKPGDLVFDPTAGHNSRMSLCVENGRDYIGCDVCHKFMEFNHRTADKLRAKHPNRKITLHECDSRKVPVASEVADFCINSPPYWDIEYYGPEEAQLGKSETYEEFLTGLGKILKETLRVLKPGAYASFHVNDFRKKAKGEKKSRMYFYHADLIALGRSVGFIDHDLIVVDLGHGIRDCFLAQAFETKIVPKRHEYAVIFRRPL